MTGRITAWALVIGAVWCVVHYAPAFRNPWSGLMAPSPSPVLSRLPSHPGCGKDCAP